MRHKDFKVGRSVRNYEPLTFSINGEQFSARPAIPGSLLLGFAARSDGSDPAAASAAVLEFFDRALLPESLERFKTRVDDPEEVIEMEDLSDIIAYLVEAYSARPTEGSSTSSPGPSTSGPSSTVEPY